jgi:hypothetical protein
MAYNPTDWQNLPNTTTPVNRNNLKKIEDELETLDTEKANVNNVKIYSTNERKIGTWMGKPAYGKVIITSEYIAPNSTINVAHNISNLGIAFKHDATIYYNGSSIPVPSHYEEQNNNLIVQEINSTNIKVTTYNESWGNYTLYIILEYTKTTD